MKEENRGIWTYFLSSLRRAHFLLPVCLFFPSYFALLAKMEMTRGCPKQVYNTGQARLIQTLIPNHSSLCTTEARKEKKKNDVRVFCVPSKWGLDNGWQRELIFCWGWITLQRQKPDIGDLLLLQKILILYLSHSKVIRYLL